MRQKKPSGRKNDDARFSDWERIQGSLGSYDPERIARLLREYLTPRIPPGTRKLPEPLREELAEGVKALLEEHLGPWYELAHAQLGSGVSGGFCWCHSFFKHKPLPNLNVEHNVQLMLKGLGESHAWLSGIDTLIQGLKTAPHDAEKRQETIANAVAMVIELTTEATGCEDAWYGYAQDAVHWLLTEGRVTMNRHLRAALKETVGAFESWVGPSPEEAQRIGDVLALAAVKEEFESRYPPGS